MLTQAQIQAASDLLFRHWQEETRLSALPDSLRPATRAEGYAIQALLEGRGKAPLFGWKIAATGADGQAHLKVNGPLAGRLLAERVHASGATLAFGRNHMRVAEPEFAFRVGRALAPRARPYRLDEVLDVVESLHPAIEVPDSRFEDFTAVGAAQLIADNACARDFVLGPAAPATWRGMDLAGHRVGGSVAGKPRREGSGANVLGDPRIALTWLANELGGLGLVLGAGQVVTTGTCLKPLAIAPGDRVLADFGELGTVTAQFDL